MIDDSNLGPCIGKNVERLRAIMGLSQASLAERVGVSRVFLNRIEKGHAIPSAGVLYALADILGVSADALRQKSIEKVSAAS